MSPLAAPAPARRLDHPVGEGRGEHTRAVPAAPVDDEQLRTVRACGLRGRERGLDAGGLVERGNDDGKAHGEILGQTPWK